MTTNSQIQGDFLCVCILNPKIEKAESLNQSSNNERKLCSIIRPNGKLEGKMGWFSQLKKIFTEKIREYFPFNEISLYFTIQTKMWWKVSDSSLKIGSGWRKSRHNIREKKKYNLEKKINQRRKQWCNIWEIMRTLLFLVKIMKISREENKYNTPLLNYLIGFFNGFWKQWNPIIEKKL